MRTLLFLTISMQLFVLNSVADGRDIAITSTCTSRETQEAISFLGGGSGWSEARWNAAEKLLQCYGGKFKLQKFLEKADGTPSSSVTYRIDALKANLSYQDKAFVSLSVDEVEPPKDGSRKEAAK